MDSFRQYNPQISIPVKPHEREKETERQNKK